MGTEEEEELRAKAIASMAISARANAKPQTNSSPAPPGDDGKLRKIRNRSSSSSSQAREEGELSSGEEDTAAEEPVPESDQKGGLPAQSVDADPLVVEHVVASLSNKSTRSASSAGKRLSANSLEHRVNVQSPVSMVQNNKQFEMLPVHSTSKNQNPVRFQHSGADDNLVIRFSSDESGSDSEECGSEGPLERRDSFLEVGKDKKLVNSLQSKVKKRQWLATNQTESVVKKVPVIHKFKPTTARTLGTNFRGPGASVENSCIRRNGSPYRASTNGDAKFVQGTKSPELEVEILRQKIALRENELKLQRKVFPERKERVSGTCEGSQGMLTETNADNLNRDVSVNMVGLTTTVKEKKHVSPIERSHTVSNSSGQLRRHNVEVTSKFEEQGTETASDIVALPRTGPQRNYKQPGENDGHTPQASNGYVETHQGKPSLGFSGVMLSTLSEHGVPSKQVNGSVSRSEDFSKTKKFHGSVGPSMLSKRSSSLMSDENVAPDMPISKKFCFESIKHPIVGPGAQSHSLLPYKDLSQDNLASSAHSLLPYKHSSQDNPASRSQHDKILSHNGILPHPRVFDEFSNHAPESTLRTFDWHPDGSSSMEFQSLAKMEEMHDKELEEAQEFRRKCELEERSALKAYRSAQKALMDANERCNYLYHKRELVSAKLRALAMGNSASLWSPRWQEENALGSMENIPKANMNLLPGVSCDSPTEQDVMNQVAQESNVQHIDHTQINSADQHTCRHQLGCGPCIEHDISTSERVCHNNSSVPDAVFSPSGNPDVYADEDEDVESGLVCRVNLEKHEEKSGNEALGRKSYIDASQDSELAEASLRSALFSRLGMRTTGKNPDLMFEDKCDSHEGADVESRDVRKSMVKISTVSSDTLAEEGKSQMVNIKGSNVTGSRGSQISAHHLDHNNADNVCSDYGSHRSTNHEESSSSLDESCRPMSATSFSLPSSILRILFRHLKVIFPKVYKGYPTMQHKESSHEGASDIDCSMQLVVYRADLIADHARDARSVKENPYASDLAIDPLWPFCMYELRGKCNDDECPWQHTRDYTKRDTKQIYDSPYCDAQASPSCVLVNSTDKQKLPRSSCQYIVPLPTYLIGSHLMKADKRARGYVLSRSTYPYWQLDFCASFPVPLSLVRSLPSDLPSLKAGDVEDLEIWNRLSLYYRNQDSTMIPSAERLLEHPLFSLCPLNFSASSLVIREGLLLLGNMAILSENGTVELSAASEQSLEKALDLCTGNFNRQEGLIEATMVLSRALEDDRTSVVLWIVYLHVFHQAIEAFGKDDMFSFAIRHNEASYELWLMYINSRMHFGDRLDAFDSALSTLCRLASPIKVSKYSSACILDLFLQMIEFLRMSGEMEKAVSRIYRVLPTAMDVNGSSTSWFTDFLSLLTISDQCILWVSCVYLLTYKKLPEMIVQRFEFEQDLLFELEWPSIELKSDKKDQVMEMMNVAVSALSINSELDEKYHYQHTSLRSAYSIAVNHVKFVAAVDGLACAENLLVKYLKLYPTCIELTLTLARLRKDSSGEERYDGFEDALCNWPRDGSGIQCLWHQYAEYALESGNIRLAEELMIRWFESSWKVQDAETGSVDNGMSGLNSSVSSDAAKSHSNAHLNVKDQLFGLLNLSLHRLLQKDRVQAFVTIDKAMKLAAAEDFKHCVREHASFVLSGGPDLDVSISDVPNILLGYLADARCFPASKPLSRRFEESIHKPRVRKLISAILGPVSLDCSLMNSILRDLYGPSLLPKNFGELKDLVDFVEGLMEILPVNYQLALSTCRLLTQNSKTSGTASVNTIFWASCLLVNCIFQAFPVVPECYWVEAAEILCNLDMDIVCERFHQQAITVYPFSFDLWASYLNLAKKSGKADAILDAAREWGIDLRRNSSTEGNVYD